MLRKRSFISSDSGPGVAIRRSSTSSLFEKPFLIFYNSANLDFLPPGAELIDNYIIADPVKDNSVAIGYKFKTLGIVA